jgi:hypothetical protein
LLAACQQQPAGRQQQQQFEQQRDWLQLLWITVQSVVGLSL